MQLAGIIQYERYQEQVGNFEKLTATGQLTGHQLNIIRQVASKHQWSNRVQNKIMDDIRLGGKPSWKAITQSPKEQVEFKNSNLNG